ASGSHDTSVLLQALVVYGTTAHHRRTPNGYSAFVPPSYAHVSAQSMSLPARPALDALARIDVRFVVVAPRARGGPWAALLDPDRARPLQLLGRLGSDLLYAVPRGSSP